MRAGIGRGLGGGEMGGGTWASREGGVKGVGGACLVGWKVCFFRLHSFVIRALRSIHAHLPPVYMQTTNTPFNPNSQQPLRPTPAPATRLALLHPHAYNAIISVLS